MGHNRGWLTPNSGATETLCRPVTIPIDDQLFFLAAVNGALLELTREWNWEQYGDMTPAEAAEVMQVLFDAYTDELCGDVGGPCVIPPSIYFGITFPTRVIRRGVGGYTEELRDNDWQEPTGEYEVPPITARSEPTSDERRCAAAWNAANVLEELYEAVTDQIAIDSSPAAVFGVIFDYVILILGAFAGPTAAAYAGLGKTFFDAFLETAETLANDVWDSTFTETLACVFYEHTTDTAGVVTFDWVAIRQAVTDEFAEAGYNFDVDRALLWGQVGYLLDITAAGGLEVAGTTTAVVAPDCSDCGEWCVYIDLGESNGGFNVVTAPGGIWTNAIGWQGSIFNAASNKYLELRLTFPDTFIQSFTIVYDKPAGAGANNSSLVRWRLNGVNVGSDATNPAGLNLSRTFTVNATIDELYLAFNSGTSGVQITFEELTFRGTGDNPFRVGVPC